jgi:dipeptidyl aminopeptidase/acylaminoacyl peptidase
VPYRFLRVASILTLVSSLAWSVKPCDAQATKKPFTLADEIGLTLFGDPLGGTPELHFSADGNYFAIWTERGRLDLNRVEDSLRFYRSQDIVESLKRPEGAQPVSPVWVITRSPAKEGRIIGDWRWLPDSSGVTFLESMASGNKRLVLADLRKKTIEPLTSAMDAAQVYGVSDVYDIRDRNHYVYVSADSIEQRKRKAERQAPAIAATGRSLNQLLLPDGPRTVKYYSDRSYYLWAVIGGKRFEVKKDGAPFANFGSFALSPDGQSLVTTLPVLDVPTAWESLYPPPPYPISTNRIHAGHYDAKSSHVHQYARIDLQTGAIQPLTDAPLADDAGWMAGGDPAWSDDGREILLPNTFLKSKENSPSRPCVAVMDVSSGASTCVEVLKAHKTETRVEEGYHLVFGARFAGDAGKVMVAFIRHEDQAFRTAEYQRTNDTWKAVRELDGSFPAEHIGLEVSVKEGLNDPPVLVAKRTHTSRVIFDPNPQLEDLELGEATVYRWKDKEGRQWKGGLYKPTNYRLGHRYPLVIQTHGFSESEFRPSGVFPTAFAARALAAAGMVVLQVEEDCPMVTPDEGPCAVSGYDAVVHKLVSEGVVDPDRVGIIGFSRTCFYVMEILTAGLPHVKAASITDGFLVGYLEYIMSQPASGIVNETDGMIGAKPFGEGLQQWLKRSPLFNLDHVSAPLLVVGMGPSGVLQMWEPYAGLRHLKKPVDLIMLNTDEHVLTNPAVRMASQGGSVDWFRFWLQDSEDPDPAKVGQYKRWRELRTLQEESEKAK